MMRRSDIRRIKPTTIRVEGSPKYCSCCGEAIPVGGEAVSILNGGNIFKTDHYNRPKAA